MDATMKLEKYTIDDVYNLPEGQRAELIDGQMYMMAPPRTNHQRISYWLGWEIGSYIRSKNGDCEVFPAPFAVFLNEDDKTCVEPDISVICDKRKLDELGCNGAPDWVVEIVSPGNSAHDYMRKLKLYMNAGVREYWIVDYQKDRILVYNFEHDTLEEYTFKDRVKAGIYEDLEIDFSKLSMKKELK